MFEAYGVLIEWAHSHSSGLNVAAKFTGNLPEFSALARLKAGSKTRPHQRVELKESVI